MYIIRSILIILAFLFTSQTSYAQSTVDPGDIDVYASYPGGRNSMNLFIEQNIIYPEIALINKQYGSVYIDAKIDTLGNIIDVNIKQGVSKELDLEALRVLKAMPKWNSARSKDKAITVPVLIVINFPKNKEAFNSKEIKRKRKELKK